LVFNLGHAAVTSRVDPGGRQPALTPEGMHKGGGRVEDDFLYSVAGEFDLGLGDQRQRDVASTELGMQGRQLPVDRRTSAPILRGDVAEVDRTRVLKCLDSLFQPTPRLRDLANDQPRQLDFAGS
jgi:hypothetical protein